jgi:hypothetical protein
MQHPNIVATYAYDLQALTAQGHHNRKQIDQSGWKALLIVFVMTAAALHGGSHQTGDACIALGKGILVKIELIGNSSALASCFLTLIVTFS